MINSPADSISSSPSSQFRHNVINDRRGVAARYVDHRGAGRDDDQREERPEPPNRTSSFLVRSTPTSGCASQGASSTHPEPALHNFALPSNTPRPVVMSPRESLDALQLAGHPCSDSARTSGVSLSYVGSSPPPPPAAPSGADPSSSPTANGQTSKNNPHSSSSGGVSGSGGGGPLSPDPASLVPGCKQTVKCVLVGDGAVGKTSMVVSYTTNGYPTEYVPTAFDNYLVVVSVDNQPVCLQLCDTAGQDDFDTLRPLCYPKTNVFLLCFSVVCPTSFHNISEKWLPEIRKNCPKAPLVLVGTQTDLRSDVKILIELANYKERPVTEAEAVAVARQIGAVSYIECSALTQKNLKEVFDTVILTALHYFNNNNNGHGSEGKSSKGSKKLKLGSRSPSSDTKDSNPPGWKKLCCFF